MIDSAIAEKRDEILRIAARHGGRNVRVFGSRTRGVARPDSDLDLLIDLDSGRSLLDIVAIKQDIEELLGFAVHVVTEEAVSHLLRDVVLREAMSL